MEADLSAGRGVLWIKSPNSSRDGKIFVARYMAQGKPDFAPGADLFVHIVYGPSGDRSPYLPIVTSARPVSSHFPRLFLFMSLASVLNAVRFHGL